MEPPTWLTDFCVNDMLGMLPRPPSERKLRLVCCASVRRFGDHLAEFEISRRAIEMAESLADGECDPRDAALTETDAERAARAIDEPKRRRVPSAAHLCLRPMNIGRASFVLGFCADSVYRGNPWSTGTYNSEGSDKLHAERLAQTRLLRDVFRNPEAANAVDWEGRSETLLALAAVAYQQRLLPSGHIDPVILAVLADAVEECGCPDQEIAEHLRTAGPHVRGCWALDLVLGKS
ncbi:MAG TPA: hypothetical protein VGE52_16035 [Pirellulales bacterium]